MLSEDDAKDDFGHLFEYIYECVVEGVRDYYRDHPHVNHKHSISSRRNVTRDYIVDRLRSVLGVEPGVHVFDRRQTTNFGIQSRYLARVHKLCESLVATLGHTQSSLAFEENRPSEALGNDFTEATCVRIGYLPIAATPMDPRVFITCPRGRKNAWSVELTKQAGGGVVDGSTDSPLGDNDDMVEIIIDPVRESNEG